MRAGTYVEESDILDVMEQVWRRGIPAWCNAHSATGELRKHDTEIMRQAVAMVKAGVLTVPKFDGVAERENGTI